jgi:hypothetical protein
MGCNSWNLGIELQKNIIVLTINNVLFVFFLMLMISMGYIMHIKSCLMAKNVIRIRLWINLNLIYVKFSIWSLQWKLYH